MCICWGMILHALRIFGHLNISIEEVVCKSKNQKKRAFGINAMESGKIFIFTMVCPLMLNKMKDFTYLRSSNFNIKLFIKLYPFFCKVGHQISSRRDDSGKVRKMQPTLKFCNAMLNR